MENKLTNKSCLAASKFNTTRALRSFVFPNLECPEPPDVAIMCMLGIIPVVGVVIVFQRMENARWRVRLVHKSNKKREEKLGLKGFESFHHS